MYKFLSSNRVASWSREGWPISQRAVERTQFGVTGSGSSGIGLGTASIPAPPIPQFQPAPSCLSELR